MKKDTSNKPFQVIMDERAHQNLKERAKQLNMSKGDFVQNLYASLEYRLARYRDKIGFTASARSDELDVKLIKFILYKDKIGLTAEEIETKLEKIKGDFEYLKNRPDITFENNEF